MSLESFIVAEGISLEGHGNFPISKIGKVEINKQGQQLGIMDTMEKTLGGSTPTGLISAIDKKTTARVNIFLMDEFQS